MNESQNVILNKIHQLQKRYDSTYMKFKNPKSIVKVVGAGGIEKGTQGKFRGVMELYLEKGMYYPDIWIC